jgi:heat shock protein HslJ
METILVRKLVVATITVSFITLFSACSPADQVAQEEVAPPPPESIQLEGTNWQLVKLTVLGGFDFVPDDPSVYSLNFRDESRLTGNSDCNRLSGTWVQEGFDLRFEPLITTRRLCPPGSLHNNLIINLPDTTAFSISGENIILTTPTTDIAMEFEAR